MNKLQAERQIANLKRILVDNGSTGKVNGRSVAVIGYLPIGATKSLRQYAKVGKGMRGVSTHGIISTVVRKIAILKGVCS